MASPAGGASGSKAAAAFVVVACGVVLARYLASAAALIAYPWDWSPDEGLYLDYARRMMLHGLSSLYGHSVVPFPSAYGPGLPVVLAPVVAAFHEPLPAARLVALAWTVVVSLAVYVLVRREAPALVGLSAAALTIAPFDLSFYLMIVRMDGLMIALWLAAATQLLPRRIEPGADRLSARRLVWGTLLMLAAVFTKPTAVLHGAPVVLGWLGVDRKSGVRLGAALAAGGLAVLGWLQWVTAGGLFWVSRLWTLHHFIPGYGRALLLDFVRSAWPLMALGTLAMAMGGGVRRTSREPALLLLLGGILIVPTLSKYGASWNYLLPLIPALAVWVGRVWGGAPRTSALCAPATAAVALGLALTRPFPLPTLQDVRTSQAFYGFIRSHVARVGGPILVTRPELAYFAVGQPVEVEGTSFSLLAEHQVPGTELVRQRLERAEYTLFADTWPLPETGGYSEALSRSYEYVGTCVLGYYFGHDPTHLLVRRRDTEVPTLVRPGARCEQRESPQRQRPER
jgi:hypothetical protein